MSESTVVVGFDWPFIRDVIYRLEGNNVIEIKNGLFLLILMMKT